MHTQRGPVAGAVPGASGAELSGRSALLASPCLLVVLRPAPAARRLRFPLLQQPAGRHPGARGEVRLWRLLLLLHARRFGAPRLRVRGSGTRGSSGQSGRSGSAALPPVRSPSLGGAWLETRWSHWLRANRGGGRVGPGAADPSAAGDEGTDAAAAVRPLAMAPGGGAARTSPTR